MSLRSCGLLAHPPPLPLGRKVIVANGRPNPQSRRRRAKSSRQKFQELGAILAKRAFRIVLIKPSHYDQHGYVIQWLRSTLPSNSLASVYGLMRECADNRVLGPDVDI
jgi:hypothetical protein